MLSQHSRKERRCSEQTAENSFQFQVPVVRNQVLLRQLALNDNSISGLQGLSSSWLPLLTEISLSKNRSVLSSSKKPAALKIVLQKKVVPYNVWTNKTVLLFQHFVA